MYWLAKICGVVAVALTTFSIITFDLAIFLFVFFFAAVFRVILSTGGPEQSDTMHNSDNLQCICT